MLDLPAVRTDLDDAIRQAIDAKTKPPGSLGRVEALAARIARVQGTLTPRLRRCRLTLFAGDHGVASEGVSAYPQAVTRQMVANFLAGGAAANVFARANGVELCVVDAGVAGDPLDAPGLLSRRIAPGTRNFAVEPAMTEEQYEAALRAGAELGDGRDAGDAGDGGGGAADAAAFGEMGIANTSSATLVAHKLTGAPLDALTGRGTGLDDDGLARKLRVLARAADRTADRLGPGRRSPRVRRLRDRDDGGRDDRSRPRPRGGDRGRVHRERRGARRGPSRADARGLPRVRPSLRRAGARRGARCPRREPAPRPWNAPRRGHRGAACVADPPFRGRDALRDGELRERRSQRTERMSRAREELAALGLAVRLLTRWPLRRRRADPAADPASSAATPTARQSAVAVAYYAAAGTLIGALAGLVFCLAHLVFPVALSVVLAIAATLLVTGALHEDGFADTCDGLGGATRERALEIMRDPRLGTYGAAGLGLVLAAKVLALAAAPVEVIPWLLVAAHTASRASMAVALASGTYARTAGIASPLAEASPAGGRIAFAILVGGVVSCTLLVEATPVALLAGLGGLALGHLLMRRAYERKLGGYTGDCLGAVQQASELGMYLGVLAALRL